MPRFRELLRAVARPATFFAIGEDLADRGGRGSLRQAHAGGIEVASHSYAHDYALSRRAPDAIREDLARGDEAILAATGTRPVGFRAPGYTLTPRSTAATAALGYLYGSSAFPAAPYYAAKAAVMGALAVAGPPVAVDARQPRVLLAPRSPYRPDPGQPYQRGSGPVLELPMAVTPGVRFPFIGTFATTLPLSAGAGRVALVPGRCVLQLRTARRGCAGRG